MADLVPGTAARRAALAGRAIVLSAALAGRANFLPAALAGRATVAPVARARFRLLPWALAAVLSAGAAGADVIDRNCLMTEMCPMTAACIPQEQPLTIRADTESGRVLFGLNGKAGPLDLRRHGPGFLVASNVGQDQIINTMVTVFPDGRMVYTVHIFNDKGTGVGLSAYGTCEPETVDGVPVTPPGGAPETGAPGAEGKP